MKQFIPTVNHAWIVRHLLAQKSIREIARILKKNPKNILFAIRRLEKNGYVIKQVRSDHSFYSLTLSGYSLLEMLKNEKGNTTEETLTEVLNRETPTEKHQKFWRLHALQFKISLKDPLPPESIHLIQFRDHPTRLRRLENHSDLIIDFQQFTVALTTRAIKVTGIQIRLPYHEVKDIHDLLDQAADVFVPEIENIEMILQKHFHGVRLRRLANNVIDVKVVKGEIALEEDELAVKVGDIQKKTKNQVKLEVKDPEDGRTAFEVDFSNGPPEAETKHPKRFADHMEIYRSFLDELISGKFYERFETISKVQEEQQALVKKTQELNQELTQRTDESINQVVELIKQLAIQSYSSLEEMRKLVVELKR